MQKLSEEAKKNKNAYINNYNKTKIRRINLAFKLDEYDEFIKKYELLENKKTYKELILQGLMEELKKNKKKL